MNSRWDPIPTSQIWIDFCSPLYFLLLTLAVSLLLETIFTYTPHPYHFPSSRLHGFLVARARSRSTLFLQAALQSQFCSYFIWAISLPQLERSNLCEKLSTAVLVPWSNSSVQMENAIFVFSAFSLSLAIDWTVITHNLRIPLLYKHLCVRRAPHVNPVAFLRVIWKCRCNLATRK